MFIRTAVLTLPCFLDSTLAILKEASYHVPLKHFELHPSHSDVSENAQNTVYPGLLRPMSGRTGYVAEVKIGDQVMNLIMDTGSSDVWVPQKGFKCYTYEGTPAPSKECKFGAYYNGDFGKNVIKNQNFNITYFGGEGLTGIMGYEDITIAGLTVKKQELALVQKGFWPGGDITSGIFGLSYESLTNAYSGNDPSKDDPNKRKVYSPVFKSMYESGQIDPVFSFAIERGAAGGYFAFGGYPPIEFNHSFANTSLLKYSNPPYGAGYTLYAIKPQGFTVNGKSTNTDFKYVIDTGSTLIYLPKQHTDAIAAAYDPPAQFLADMGAYFVNCTAKAPRFGVQISDRIFYVNAADLIYKGYKDPMTGLCLSGFSYGGDGGLLGSTFLRNVVAVFDVGSEQMHFAPHENY